MYERQDQNRNQREAQAKFYLYYQKATNQSENK